MAEPNKIGGIIPGKVTGDLVTYVTGVKESIKSVFDTLIKEYPAKVKAVYGGPAAAAYVNRLTTSAESMNTDFDNLIKDLINSEEEEAKAYKNQDALIAGAVSGAGQGSNAVIEKGGNIRQTM